MNLARYKPREDGRIALPPLPFGWDDLVMFCWPSVMVRKAYRAAMMHPRNDEIPGTWGYRPR